MTITVDATNEAIRTGTGSPTTLSVTGHASLIKGAALFLIHGTSSTDHISAASWGGTAMSRIVRATDTATEQGAAEIWWLGAMPGVSIPQGTQNFSYTSGATTDDIHALGMTFLADTLYLQIASFGSVNENAANPSVALITGGWSGMAVAAMYSGLTDIASVTAGASCTAVGSAELAGNFTSRIIRQTTGGTANFTIAATSASDDVGFAAMMIVEYTPLAPIIMAPPLPAAYRRP